MPYAPFYSWLTLEYDKIIEDILAPIHWQLLNCKISFKDENQTYSLESCIELIDSLMQNLHIARRKTICLACGIPSRGGYFDHPKVVAECVTTYRRHLPNIQKLSALLQQNDDVTTSVSIEKLKRAVKNVKRAAANARRHVHEQSNKVSDCILVDDDQNCQCESLEEQVHSDFVEAPGPCTLIDQKPSQSQSPKSNSEPQPISMELGMQTQLQTFHNQSSYQSSGDHFHGSDSVIIKDEPGWIW